jgi:hypothetical protein
VAHVGQEVRLHARGFLRQGLGADHFLQRIPFGRDVFDDAHHAPIRSPGSITRRDRRTQKRWPSLARTGMSRRRVSPRASLSASSPSSSGRGIIRVGEPDAGGLPDLLTGVAEKLVQAPVAVHDEAAAEQDDADAGRVEQGLQLGGTFGHALFKALVGGFQFALVVGQASVGGEQGLVAILDGLQHAVEDRHQGADLILALGRSTDAVVLADGDGLHGVRQAFDGARDDALPARGHHQGKRCRDGGDQAGKEQEVPPAGRAPGSWRG